MRQRLAKAGLAGEVDVDSAGTGGWHAGDAPDRRAVAEAERRGVPMSGRARQVGGGDLRDFDLIIAMDTGNLGELKQLAGDEQQRAKLHLLREWDPEAGPHERSVPDPYYGGQRDFAEMFDIIERAADGFVAALGPQFGVK